jgi:hypothetical protein
MDGNISSLKARKLARLARKAALFLILMGGLFVGLAPKAVACLCMPPLSGKHPCQSYWASDVVFTGLLSELTEVETKYGKRLVARFNIEEAFRGVDTRSIEVYTGFGGGDCGYPFGSGYRYFVYAHRDLQDGRISTSSCSGTTSLEGAAQDLEYARAMRRGETNGVIFGVAIRYLRPDFQTAGRHEAMPQLPVVIEGNGLSFTRLTDKNGRFLRGGLPEGKYRVRMELPEGLPPLPPQEVMISKMKCAAMEFVASSLAMIKGRLVDAEGISLGKTPVHLIPTDENIQIVENGHLNLRASTEADGSFAIPGIPPGEYLLVLNPHVLPNVSPRSYDPPYPRTYFPGTSARDAGKVFQVSKGEQIEIEDFKVLPRLVTGTINGQVEWPDGMPAVGVYVILESPDYPNYRKDVMVDESGRFEIEGYKGYRYRLVAQHSLGGNTKYSKPIEIIITDVSESMKLTISKDGLSPVNSQQTPTRKP